MKHISEILKERDWETTPLEDLEVEQAIEDSRENN